MESVPPEGPAIGATLYIHVPFCERRCPYCDFHVLTGAGGDLMAQYVAALRAELVRTASAGPKTVAPPYADVGDRWPLFGSIFVGGGTPTQLPAAALDGLLRAVGEQLPVMAGAEVTVEANPEDIDVRYAEQLVAAGVTRLSIGAQSFAPHVLAFLARNHDAAAPLRAVAAARAAGLGQVSLDLIYGTPGETDADWATTLESALAAGIDHVSCYALTVEPNTVYGTAVRRHAQPAPDEDTQAERMATADRVLTAAGMRRYEVSNWAVPGSESRHNRNYWRGGDWLGLGAAAHGHWRGRRRWNVRSTPRYTELALAGMDATGGEELVDAPTRRLELLMTSLRTVEGVARADAEPLDEAAAADLVARGLLRDDGARLAPTPAGWPLADAMTRRLMAR